MPLTLNGTTGEVFPSWTTATRPASPSAGQTGFNTTTGQMETYDGTSWTVAVNPTSQGTSGQVLTSAGAGAAPTWGSASGALIRAPQILISGTSYTPPAGCTSIYVEAVGGGGGGGGASTASLAAGAGGGSGGYSAKYFTVTGNTPPYTYAIGAGGSGGVGNATGSTGGSTTFTVGATTITANGGTGGTGSNSGTGSQGRGGSGGTASGGDLNVKGNPGSIRVGGAGGSGGGGSFFGGGGDGIAVTGSNGLAGEEGGGGGGAYSSGGTQTGGAGGAGVIRIWEFT